MRVLHSVWYLFVATAVLVCQSAAATSYARATSQEITERTDAWLHVRVRSISDATIQRGPGGDPIQDINLRVDVLSSTDNQVPKIAALHFNSVFFVDAKAGSEAFVAVSAEAQNPKILDVYDWTPIVAPSMVETPTGLVDSSLYWQWLCGLRRNADAWGKVSDEDLRFWKQHLTSSDTAVATLALDFFQGLHESTMDAASLFAVFLNAYGRATQSPAQSEQSRYEIQRQLSSVASTVAWTLRTYDADSVGGIILDFIEDDRTKLNLMSVYGFQDTLLRVLRSVKDPQTLARIPDIYETYCEPRYQPFESVPVAPSPEIDAWLWSIVHDPVAHGIRTDLDLAGVWAAMERRNMEDLLPYLRRIADGSEMPPEVALNQENMPLAIRHYATDIIKRFER